MLFDILSILAAAASAFLVGGIWYSALFAKAWQKAAGLSDEELADTNPIRLFGSAFLVNVAIAAMIHSSLASAWSGPATAPSDGLLLGLFVSACLGLNYLFERKSLALWAINSGYFVVQLTIMCLIMAWIVG